jgi:hypothetical protein
MKKTGDETVKREQGEGQYVERENGHLEENNYSDKQVVFISQRTGNYKRGILNGILINR